MESYCAIEMDTLESPTLTHFPATAEKADRIDSLRILTFDIEVNSAFEFPTAGKYPIVCIGNIVSQPDVSRKLKLISNAI